MTTYVHRTLIVPSTLVDLARSLASALAGPPGAGMWTTGLSASGTGEPTHYVSSGMIEDTFVGLLTNATALNALVQEAGLGEIFSTESIEMLVAQSDVSGHEIETEEGVNVETPFQAIQRLGLQLTTHPEQEIE